MCNYLAINNIFVRAKITIYHTARDIETYLAFEQKIHIAENVARTNLRLSINPSLFQIILHIFHYFPCW